MKINARLAIGFLVAVALILPAAAVSLHTYHQIHQQFEAMRGGVIPGVLAVAEMEQASTDAHHCLMEHMVHDQQEDAELAQWVLARLKAAGLKHLAHERHIAPAEQEVAEQLLARIDTFALAVTEIIDLKRRGTSAAELRIKENQTVHPAAAALSEQLSEHKAAHLEELAEAEEAVHAAHNMGTRLVAIATLCAALAAIASAVITSRSIVRPLQTLQKGTEIIAGGDLGYRIHTDRKDEIGQLGRSFDRMTQRLSETLVSKDALTEANSRLASDAADRERIQDHVQKNVTRLLRFSRLASKRELRMMALKREVNDLLAELGRDAKYGTGADVAEANTCETFDDR